MQTSSQPKVSSVARYLKRGPERLVLEGYRAWTYTMATQDNGPWRLVATDYAETLGDRGAASAISALSEFIRTLGLCATCPLKMHRNGSNHICRDEALVLGLISAIQMNDEATAEFCLNSLACKMRCEEVAFAAGQFALVLKALGKTLMPIPETVIRGILAGNVQPFSGANDNTTLH